MRQWLQIIKESTIGTTPSADSTNSVWIDIEETDPAVNLTPVDRKSTRLNSSH